MATSELRRTAKRSSKQPHEPAIKVDSEPTAGLLGTVVGKELGADGEEQIAEDDRVNRNLEAGASSSGGDRPIEPKAGRGPD